jgi:hypothetical protein
MCSRSLVPPPTGLREHAHAVAADDHANTRAGAGRRWWGAQSAGGQRGMLSAYVLIQTGVGKAAQAAQAVRGINVRRGG